VRQLRRAYDAFNRRDIDAVLAILDPEVEWPNVLDGTMVRGRRAVREYWERQFRQIDPHVEPTEIIPHGDGLIVAVHQIVRDLDGHVLSDSYVAHAYAFRGELIQTMRVHASVEDATR
jgi:ketosteroid isomerase-like protein